MAGEEETGHWALAQCEKFDGDGVRDGNRRSADVHSRIATTWSYNEVVELGNCLKMKENESLLLLHGVLILDPQFCAPKGLQFNI